MQKVTAVSDKNYQFLCQKSSPPEFESKADTQFIKTQCINTLIVGTSHFSLFNIFPLVLRLLKILIATFYVTI